MAQRSRRLVAVSLSLALAGGALSACSSTPPDDTLKRFAAGIPTGEFGSLSVQTSSGQPVTKDLVTKWEGDLAGKQPKIKVGEPSVKKDTAQAKLSYSWPVANGVTWDYTSVVRAKRVKDDKWQVYFDPATLHPDLTATDKIVVKRAPADRGQILDGSGAPIVTKQPVINVQVQPNQIPDVDGVVRSLDRALQSIKAETGPVDLSGLAQEIKAAKPDQAVPVVLLRKSSYTKIRDQIYSLPGVQFPESTAELAPSRVFAKALLGRVGDVTKEQLEKNPGRYQIGDRVGQGGLQEQYNDVLAGSPGVSVVLSTAGKELFRSDPKPGAAIKTTLDPKVQTAADTALASQPNRSALVAIRVSDGATVAVANGPDGGELNLALTAKVAPGSTFKTITALGVLDNGSANANTVVPCPKEFTAPGGTPIHNSHDLPLGDNAQLHQDFAQSCNTAFASLGSKLGPDGLAKTAQTVGIGAKWDIGAPVFSGTVATGADSAEQAAAAFGQGKTQVSPAALAGAAAAIARGQWKQPKLITDPAPKEPAADGPQLKPESLTALRQMMGEVVSDPNGTAKSIRNTPGGPIYGKTGTAEFDDTNKEKTHSWFMGYQGDIAFAVFVENGGLSSDAAVPLAGKFLAGLR